MSGSRRREAWLAARAMEMPLSRTKMSALSEKPSRYGETAAKAPSSM